MLKRINIFFVFYNVAVYVSQALLIFWLYKNGFGFSDLVIYSSLTFFFALIILLYLPKKKINAKKVFYGVHFLVYLLFCF